MKKNTPKLWLYSICALAIITLIGSIAMSCDDNLSTTSTGTAPTITTAATLPGGTVGVAYNQTLQASGDTPITWSLVAGSGSLPTGLSLAPTTGVISGTPSTAANSTFTVKAENAVGPTTKQFTIAIAQAAQLTAPTITTTSLPPGTVGTAYSQTLTATGSTPITWSIVAGSGSLPAGLSLASTTGVISGTPTTAGVGTSTFTVKAENAAGPTTKELSITITAPAGPPSLITTINVNSQPIGFESDTINLVNGTQPNYWVRGTNTAKSGTYSLYITNDGNTANGTGNHYLNNQASVVHAYVDATIPADGAYLRFNWKAMGETPSTAYDYLRVFTAPAGTTPVAGILETSGATQLGSASYRSGSATLWGQPALLIPASYNNGTVRIIFTWRNDNTSGSQPPAAIDNIELIAIVANGTETTKKLTVGGTPIGFESAEDSLVLANGTQPNSWVRGTATAKTGTHSLYISNDNGTTNAYTTTISSVSHAYIDAVIPSTGAYLRFNWKAQGETSSAAYDYLRVYIAPTTTVPVAGILTPLGADQLGSMDYRMNGTSWGQPAIQIPSAHQGTTRRIIFTWVNDSSSGAQPPAAIDNIELVENVVAPSSTETATKLTVGGVTVDFESSTLLTLVNGTQPNYWVRGIATAQAGTYSLYITNDGAANAYTTTVSSVSYAYIDADIPSAATNLRFNWRAQGESSSTAYDYLRVYIAPTTTVPVAGILDPAGATQLGSTNFRMGGATTWGEAVIPIPSAHQGTTRRIIFTWVNNSSSGAQPPAAIDNIKLE